ncbi:MAG: hypothetical protein P4L31_00620 [Candidatus Babeliales bacterium]|nr:hypothetical protein [Candidatus Babeliales bacterium]
MSIQYYIDLKLNATYSKENIIKILQQGLKRDLCYYDHILGERYENSPTLNAEQAANKVIKALEENIDGGPCVYAKIEETNGFLSFYKSEDGWFEFRIGGFGSPNKKDFLDGVYYIDFDYYIRMALDLCKGFAIVELKTDAL